MTGPSLALARELVSRALQELNDPPPRSGREPFFTACQGSPVPYVDLKNVTDEDAAIMCAGCPLKRRRLPDGSVRNICLMLGRAEGGAAVGYVYGGQVMRRTGRVVKVREPKPVRSIARRSVGITNNSKESYA